MPQNLDKALWQKAPEFRNLIRMLGTSIDGTKTLALGLSDIRGLNRRLALAIIRLMGLEPASRIGMLTDEQLEKIEKAIKDPLALGVPVWMINRPKDPRTGENRHISGNDIDLVNKMDVDRMKRLRSWKGLRHMYNLKVRGQHTRTTGRSGLVVGYLRQNLKKKSGGTEEPAK